jgi:putative transposase
MSSFAGASGLSRRAGKIRGHKPEAPAKETRGRTTSRIVGGPAIKMMSQSLAKVYLHVIFSTKNREPLLEDSWRDELFSVLAGTANNLGCQSLIVRSVADHVHILFELSRTISIADAVGKIKSCSSLWINQTPKLSAPFHWQAGYAAFSVSKSNVEAVRDYIFRQPEHHTRQTYQDELREWLQRYEIEWDERYLWDDA